MLTVVAVATTRSLVAAVVVMPILVVVVDGGVIVMVRGRRRMLRWAWLSRVWGWIAIAPAEVVVLVGIDTTIQGGKKG